ncbi:XRE family transcriptional regulator [Streptomyces sp. 8K308]|uniref:helix-turn-helix domain-containing protein n=1 Tax=Streptomyces sp. 8K308 TaxID=2530388 RepID=UPI0010516528|nr:helix-turn-helix transcriptional regulator [Streptomyces sp. 8K308]TDC24278.1 XRE family transcriptional regulator [Streptomyces sp. 8K308]
MPHRSDEHTGARIARARKVRRLTQKELADLAPVSYSTITKIEQGILPASPAVVNALARALSVPVTELTGQPYMDELRKDQLDGLIQPIREALDVYDYEPEDDVVPRPLADLVEHAEELCALVRRTDLKRAAAELPGLIYEATATAHVARSTDAWQLLASTYRTAYDVTSKLGFPDLCTVALDRMDWAAHRASDPVLSSMRQYMRALAYLRSGQYQRGQQLVRLGMRALEQTEAGRERDVVTGQLHLGSAVLAARDQDKTAAEGFLAEAERLAKLTGPAEKVHWLSFGPVNVAVHRTSVLAELDEYDEAVRSAATVGAPEDWPPSRLAHHHAEVARAQLWTGDTEGAFKSLQEARRLAPQQTRYHPTVRETYAGLDAAKRQLPQTFVGYGSWLGM